MKKLPLSKIKTRVGKNKTSYYYKAKFGKCSLTGDPAEKYLTADTPQELQAKFDDWFSYYYSNGKTLLDREKYNLRKDNGIRTYNDLINVWLENLSVKPATANGYKSRARCHLSPHIGKYKIGSLTISDLQRVIDKITNELAPKCDLWERVVYDYQKLFEFATKRRYIADNLMKKVDYDIKKTKNYLKSLKIEDDDEDIVKVYDGEQLKKILATVEEYSKGNVYQAPCFAIYIKMLIYSGFRPSEALALTWEDVDFKLNKIRINKTITNDDSGIGTPKTKSSKRTIKMSESFMKELLKFKHSQQLYYWRVTEKNNQPTFVFTNMKSIMQGIGYEWYTLKNFRNIWKRLCRNNDIPLFEGSTLHCFRHTHATTQLLQSTQSYEVKMKLVSKRLGHSDVFETMKTYHHLFPEQKTSFDEDFDSYMNELSASKTTLKIV